MKPENAKEIDKLLARYRGGKLRIVQGAAGMALAFFKDSFVQQGFTDTHFEAWPGRNAGMPDKGRAMLVKTGTLKRSLRIKQVHINGAIIGVDWAIPYAELQNSGGKIRITPKMRRFFWAMYYQAAGKMTYNVKTKAASATKANEKLNDQASFWKNMAITKEEFITIPKRQYIGESAVLDGKIKAYIGVQLDKIFKDEH
jgi:hypothetical protein